MRERAKENNDREGERHGRKGKIERLKEKRIKEKEHKEQERERDGIKKKKEKNGI